MNTTITRRIVTALAGPAVAAGILAGGLALGAPALAQTTAGTAPNRVTAPVLGTAPDLLNPLTRTALAGSGSVGAAYESINQPTVTAVSCLGR
jgi:hypothetical protein